jgi:hypothetical protein
MKAQEVKRKVIAELHSAGNDAAAIIRVTKYPRSTVYDVIKRLNAGKGIGHSSCGPSKNKKRTGRFLFGLKRSIMANPAVSMSVHAARRSVSRRTIATAVKDDLGLKSYVRGRRHLLTK